MTIKTIYIPAGGGFDNVSIETSRPADPAPGEITVRLRASSLNFHDYMVVKGITGPKERRIPMSDGAGEVIAVGEGVSGFSVGAMFKKLKVYAGPEHPHTAQQPQQLDI